MLYDGKVADTLFLSTSGGRTVSALEATGVAVPYLVSVTDPYDTLSPYHDWGPVLLDAAKVRRQLKLSAPIAELSVTRRPVGPRASSSTVDPADDSQATFTGNQVRAALGLRSTWFQPALLAAAPSREDGHLRRCASRSRGFARGATGVTLEAKPAGADWAPAGRCAVAGPGRAFTIVVKPQVATQYRLA